jgi:hypothetical protein
MPELRTYDAKKVIITLGSHTVTGYAEGTFVSIEPEGDGTVAQAGADGEVARSLSNNPLHTINITLQQTSPSNDAFSELLRRDRASGGRGVVPLQVRDLRGSTLFAASQAWVTNWPTIENGSELNDREWAFMGVMTDVNVGGNEA